MFEKRHEEPIAEQEREGLVERKRAVAPGQKLILIATSTVAALLILFGIASKNNFFGAFGAPAPARSEMQIDGQPLTAPDVKVPLALALGQPAAPPSYVECPGGLRLPIGLNCPEPDKKPDAAQPAQSSGMSEEDRVRERRRKSAINLAAAQPTSAAVAQLGTAMAIGSLPGASTPSGGTNALASALSATITPGTSATINRNPSMTLAKGTLPDCTLLTAILTDQPGFLKCILSAPVMSMDGKVVLMEAGTTMEGEYAQGVQAGQKAIFTLWSRAVTPNFVSVQLISPGTDALGRAGTTGYVDNKWFERFAGAVFFSLLEDGKQIYIARDDARATQRASGSGDTFNIGTQGTLSQFNNTGSSTKTIVEEMLKQGSQLRPSLYKNQGEIIKVFVARDVDFSTVYELRPAAGTN
ncbi:TrbI/VirB10 family protein [Variovorax guangxiensis]|uniref:TrbI/VirB10 family protein n=1 Tax=Variovorax guangxiensis TaxID=1775474 RepID=UPI00285EDA00|nr:TrbI/VirB10 family protein [Variovorax guangxiensis]MDR6861261.1 type IV secretion system protein VirB10 [Variovorax guangxiensis]